MAEFADTKIAGLSAVNVVCVIACEQPEHVDQRPVPLWSSVEERRVRVPAAA